jgi:hypothetical protein
MQKLELKLKEAFKGTITTKIQPIEFDSEGGLELVINNKIFINLIDEDDFEVFHEEDDLNNFYSLEELIDYIREKLEEAI